MSGGEASHYRGRSSLYKPAKAGCTGHSLPTVTRRSARTRPRLWSAQRPWLGGRRGSRTWGPAAVHVHIQILLPWSLCTHGFRSPSQDKVNSLFVHDQRAFGCPTGVLETDRWWFYQTFALFAPLAKRGVCFHTP